MTELQLYKFIHNNSLEIDWRGKELVVWIPFYHLDEFTKMFNCSAEEQIMVNLQDGNIAMDIVDLCDWYGIEPQNIYPME